MVRRSKFPRPTSFRLATQASKSRSIIIEPVLGLNVAQPAMDLKPGETPDSENFVVEDGFLVPRSGLSSFATFSTSIGDVTGLGTDVGLLAFEHVDVNGGITPVIASAETISVFGLTTSWSTLSYVVRYAGAADDTFSGQSTDHIRAASFYEPNADQHLLCISNGSQSPKVWQPSQATFSDLSDFLSVESMGAIPYSIDDRLCFFNCGSLNTTFATRVRWSERGLTSNFSTFGAGFQDLMDMRGVGTAAVPREIDALLFTDREIWVQRPRRDQFAFDFVPLSRRDGCPYPKTVALTPAGTIFMNREFEIKMVQGSVVKSIGGNVHNLLRKTIQEPSSAFGLYNSRFQRYELYYRTVADLSRPGHALYLDIDNGSFTLQELGIETGAGFEVQQTIAEFDIIWDNIFDDWNDIDITWNNMVQAGATGVDKKVMLVGSNGTAYRFDDDQTTDDGSTITAFWTSHILVEGADFTRKQSFYELYTTADNEGAGGEMTLEDRAEPGEGFGNSQTITFETSNAAVERANVFVTGRQPQFKITVNNGTRPRFARFSAKVRDAGDF